MREPNETERAAFLATPFTESFFHIKQRRGGTLPYFTKRGGGMHGVKKRAKGWAIKWLYSFDGGRSWSDNVIEAVDKALAGL